MDCRSTPPSWWSSTHLWGGRHRSPAAEARRPWLTPALTTRWPPPTLRSMIWSSPTRWPPAKTLLSLSRPCGRVGTGLWSELAKQGRLLIKILFYCCKITFTRPPCLSSCLASSVALSSLARWLTGDAMIGRKLSNVSNTISGLGENWTWFSPCWAWSSSTLCRPSPQNILSTSLQG